MQRRLPTQPAHSAASPVAGGPVVTTAGSAWRPIVLVFLPFASGYYLSYLYRTINALISPSLVAEFTLRPADLGLLTSAYFLAFGLIQLPLGVLLDRYGPRRVQSAFLIVASVGAVVFSSAGGLTELIAGRALIGLGVAGALMAGLKAIVLWFPKERVALANGWFIMLGALGAVSATAPAEFLLAQVGWRHLFAILATLTALSAITIHVIVPQRRSGVSTAASQGAMSLGAIYSDPRFWRLAPLSATCIGTAWALQGLWAAPWLTDVDGFARAIVVRHLLVMAMALSAAALLLGVSADRLRRRGISHATLMALTCTLAIAAQLAIVLQIPGLSYVLWAAVGGVGAVTVLSYAILAEGFPKDSIGRVNGALNLLHVGYAFLVQTAIGVIIQQWPVDDGHVPAAAYQTALAINLAVQMAALIWFVRPEWRIVPEVLAAHPIHQMAAGRCGGSPEALIGYRRAVEEWGGRVRAARVQAASWRLAAIGSLLLAGVLGTTLMTVTLSSKVVPHLVAAEAE